MGTRVDGMVVSSSRKDHTRVWLISLAAFICLAGGAGLVYYTVFYNPVKAPTIKEVNAQIKQTEQLAGQRKYAQEAQALQQIYDSSSSSEVKQLTLLRMAAAYANDKQYDKAIDIYQQVVDTYPSGKIPGTEGMALVHMQRGKSTNNRADLQKSLDYYQAAVELEKQDKAYASAVDSDESNVLYVKGLISALGS